MHDSLLMGGVQRFCNIQSDSQRTVQIHGTAVDDLEEGVAFEKLHHDERTVAVLADFIHRADIGMI